MIPNKAAAAVVPAAPAPVKAATTPAEFGGDLYHVSIAGQAFDVRVKAG